MEGATAPPGARAGEVVPAPTSLRMESRIETATASLLEALRLGVIPGSRVGEYTVGRDALFDQLGRDLDGLDSAGQFRVIMGDYGSGKSHALEWLREEAISRGFLTASAELDDREVTWANPKRVYRALMDGLAYPDLGRSAHGLAPLVDRLLRTGGSPLPPSDERYHRYLDPAVDNLARARERGDEDLEQRILDWIGGQPSEDSESWNRALGCLRGPNLLALADFRTFSHIYAYLLGGVASRAREVGYKGLVLLLDEAEFFQALSRENREHASHLIACLALAARGERRVCFDPATLPKGGQPVHRLVPFVYREGQPLYVVVALTPVDEMRDLLGRLLPLDQVVLELSRLTPRDYQTLFQRIVGLYPVPVEQRGLLAELAAPMGKTEAVTAPLAERILTERWEGLAVVYVSPTRALVNDLYRRLLTPLVELGISLDRRTSDHPRPIGRKPPRMLITTPESLDSLLCRQPRTLRSVRALVLDEVHLLEGSARGDQAAMLVSRIRKLVAAATEGRRVQVVALSATVGTVDTIVDRFLEGGTVVTEPGHRPLEMRVEQGWGVEEIAARLKNAVRELGAPKLLVFVNRRQDAEQLAGELARQLPFEGQVHAHHGSLSRALRESVDLPGLARISEAGLVGPGDRGLPDGLPYL
ncbi:MAG: DUF2791 family P-loop domain-containing protein [Candidatus Riflebacteria bacterium]|nr:DUF2791 family P-loop domain-containing protein [Candidatus Riflebacteria bacterium]